MPVTKPKHLVHIYKDEAPTETMCGATPSKIDARIGEVKYFCPDCHIAVIRHKNWRDGNAEEGPRSS